MIIGTRACHDRSLATPYVVQNVVQNGSDAIMGDFRPAFVMGRTREYEGL
jgi:hypothetical protein